MLEHLSDNRRLRYWEGTIPIESLYTVGIAGERFFRALKDEGRILGVRCGGCDLLYVPPAIYCERCFAELDDWHEVPSRGSVETFTVLHRDREENRLERPEVLALVRLGGPAAALIHRIGEVEPAGVRIGQEVEAVFKPASERRGMITDICYFKPL